MSFSSVRKACGEPETVTNLLSLRSAGLTPGAKCRATTKHVVIEKVGPKPTRVRCGTCEFDGIFTARRRGVRRRRPRRSALEPRRSRSRVRPPPYSPDTGYRVGSR